MSEQPADKTSPVVRDDAAIIGMACTYPGARNLTQFWQNIVNRVDAITDVSPERWDPEIFYDPDPAREDRVYCKKGGWIGSSFAFNPLKYGIMPSTLEGAEPDHFLVLRAVYEALEDAGYLNKKIDGLGVSVTLGKGNYMGPGVTALMYRGIVTEQTLAILKSLHPEFTTEQLERIKQGLRAKLPKITPEVAAGLIPNICTGRVANRLGFMGRNFTVDAACASSLIATELGLHDLLSGRVDMTLVGGVHIFAHVPFLQVFDVMRALSLTSVIRPYDEDCDGTISGEGVGILVLKRLKDAERDGDRIYAVIKGAGSSSDGRAKGVTAPRVEGEELALRRAYEMSGVLAETLELIEGHGTATPVGDAAEIEALTRVFGPKKRTRPPCAIGSVKSMIGHAMPAAGAAGMIKTALALYHRVLPATLNCRKPHSALANPESPFYVNTETRPWIHAPAGAPRRAGVNAFGFGGVNAHVVLEEYNRAPENHLPTLVRDWQSELVVVQADSRGELIAAIDRLRAYVAQAQGVPLRDIAATLNCSLRPGSRRLAVVALSLPDLAHKLDHAKNRLNDPECTQIRDRQGIFYFESETVHGAKIALLFPGEGAQYVNMLSDLCITFPEVRQAFDFADSVADPSRDAPSAIVFPPPSFSDEEAAAAEAPLWTIERATEAVLTADAAVLKLLQGFGLKADMMAGHSAGEWVAMAAAGVLDPTEFVSSMDRLAAVYRNIAESSNVACMSMLAVGAGHDRVAEIVREIGCEVHLANDNCAHQVVVVVSPKDEAAAIAQLQRAGIFVEKLPYDRGYHTPVFTYICEPLRQYFSTLQIRSPQLPLYCCTTGNLFPSEPAQILELASRTFARPLLFRQTVEAMYQAGARIFVEVGPRGNLTAFVDDILRGREHLGVAVDQFRRPGLVTLHHALAMLVAANVSLDLNLLYARRATRTLTFDPVADRIIDEDCAPGTVQVSTCYPSLQLTLPPESRVQLSPTHEERPHEMRAPAPVEPPPQPQFEMPLNPDIPSLPAHVSGGHAGNGATPAWDTSGVLNEHVNLMEEFLKTHEAVMLGFLGNGSARIEAPASSVVRSYGPPPALAREVVSLAPVVAAVPVPSRTLEPTLPPDIPAIASQPSTLKLRTMLLRVVSERTGYPEEILDLDADMEADLGIDSIKRVEILAMLRQIGNGSIADDADMEDVARLKTLRQILAVLESAVAGAEQQSDSPAIAAPDPKPGPLTRASSVVAHVPGRSITLLCEIDVREHRYLEDHCLYFHPSERKNATKPVLSMPLTGSLEIMAETVARLFPDLRVTGARNVQALRWINLDRKTQRTVLSVSAERIADFQVKVVVRTPASDDPEAKPSEIFAEAVILLGGNCDRPPSSEPLVLEDSRQPACTGHDLYTTHRMFHGPRFQGIAALNAISQRGLLGRLKLLPNQDCLHSDPNPTFHIDPFLLDAAGQMVGYWPVESLSEGFVALPFRLGELTIFDMNLAPGTELECRVQIREVSRRQIRADFDLVAPDGRVWIRVKGWEDWRFYWEWPTYEFWRFPNKNGNGRALQIPTLEADGIECCRLDPLDEVDKTGLWETLWMHMTLHEHELEEAHGITDLAARTEWLFSKAVAKDAVRRWIKRRYNRDLYPADIDVRVQADGNVEVRGHWMDDLGTTPRVAVAFASHVAVAAAGDGDVAVVIAPADSDRFRWAASAARRLLNSDDPVRTSVDPRGCISVSNTQQSVTVHCACDQGFLVCVANRVRGNYATA